jgi:hypothetical protein
MKGFRQYISESTSGVTFTFGRFNPPTIGHEKLLDKVSSVSSGGAFRVYASQSSDPQKNPLKYEEKIRFMRKMFPKYGRNIVKDASVKNVFDILVKLYKEGFSEVTMVVGSDRVREFQIITNKYNGVDARHGFYNFEGGVNIVSAGDRDPDSDAVSGMSASKLRAAAAAEDFDAFMKGMPATIARDARDLFNAVRKGMGLQESYDFRRKVKFDPISEEREAYVNGELFEEGDIVRINESWERCPIVRCASNYVIVEHTDGKRRRMWLQDVTLVDTVI